MANYQNFWWRMRWRTKHLVNGLLLISTLRLTPRAFVRLWRLMEKDSHYILFSFKELAALYRRNQVLQKYDASILEVGVYRGVSLAALALSKKNDDVLYGVDTFAGLPQTCAYENHMVQGKFFQTPEAAIDKAKTSNLKLIKGIFPNTVNEIFHDKVFKLVHVDTDIFQSTYETLEYIHDKVISEGVVVVHDYIKLSGVTKAVQAFLINHPNWNIDKIVDTHVYLNKTP